MMVNDASVLPLTLASDKQKVIGCLVLGISPRLAFDSEYQNFFDLATVNVEATIANVEAYEAERQRAGEEARVEGLAAGANDYLIKPFSARELLARVEASLKLAQSRQEASDRERQLNEQSAEDLAEMTRLYQVSAQLLSDRELESLLKEIGSVLDVWK